MTSSPLLTQANSARDVTPARKTNAERQAAYRRRRADRIAELEAEVARLRDERSDAHKKTIADAEELHQALLMARQFLGMAIPGSKNCAATVVDDALAKYEAGRNV